LTRETKGLIMRMMGGFIYGCNSSQSKLRAQNTADIELAFHKQININLVSYHFHSSRTTLFIFHVIIIAKMIALFNDDDNDFYVIGCEIATFLLFLLTILLTILIKASQNKSLDINSIKFISFIFHQSRN